MKKSIMVLGVVTVPLVAAGVAISKLAKAHGEHAKEDQDGFEEVVCDEENMDDEVVEFSEQGFNFGVAKKDNLDAEFNRIKNSINDEDYREKNALTDSDVAEILDYMKSSNEYKSYNFPHINKYILPLIKIFQPKTYEDLKSVIAIGFGTGTWNDGGKTVFCDKKTDLHGLITYRESISNYLMSQGLDEDEIKSIVSNVEYGRVKQGKSEKWHTEWKYHMLDKDVPEWYVWLCEQIDYLIDETAAENYTNLFLSRLFVSKYNSEVDLYENEEIAEENV